MNPSKTIELLNQSGKWYVKIHTEKVNGRFCSINTRVIEFVSEEQAVSFAEKDQS